MTDSTNAFLGSCTTSSGENLLIAIDVSSSDPLEDAATKQIPANSLTPERNYIFTLTAYKEYASITMQDSVSFTLRTLAEVIAAPTI